MKKLGLSVVLLGLVVIFFKGVEPLLPTCPMATGMCFRSLGWAFSSLGLLLVGWLLWRL